MNAPAVDQSPGTPPVAGPTATSTNSMLITGALVAALVVSAAAAAALGLVAFLITVEAQRGSITGSVGFLFVYALGLLAAVEAAAATALTLWHRRTSPSSLPHKSAYLRLAQSVAIAVGCFVALLCVGVLVTAIAGWTTPAIAGWTTLVLLVVFAVAALPALVWFARRRRDHATTLRTRAFVVILMAMVIPCLVLSALGVSAYFLSWNTAGMLYWDQASYGARMLDGDVGSLRKVPGGLDAAAKARLSREIVRAFADYNRNGALRSTMDYVKAEHILPRWAIRSLERRGYAIGLRNGRAATGGRRPDVVAWRVGARNVRYIRSDYINSPGTVDAPQPISLVGRFASAVLAGVVLVLALGLFAAWILSRGVVRPVRRLAEASGRLAEGEAGVTVTPEGPRELRELAASFNDMNAKMAKAQETEQAFLLSVSHELKTPLTSIRGYAEGIGDGTVEADQGAAVIGAESARLERLVGDLLESGRMRKAAFAVRREAVDLAAVAADVARRYEATARDAGLVLHLNTEAAGAAVADHDRVVQVVSNLVENAIRCTPAPGTVTITTAPGTITVADTGRGLTGDDLPRAFERFYLYSRYGTDRPVGTGLGLAIVKELTEAMGGTVSVSSAVGVGTAFTVALPAGPAPDAPAQGAEVTEATTPGDEVTEATTPGADARSPAATPVAPVAAQDDAP